MNQNLTMRALMFFSFLSVSVSTVANGARAQTALQPGCDSIRKSMASDVIPRDKLEEWQGALRCLMQIVAEMKDSVSSVQDVVGRPDLLKAVKAMRVILDDKANGERAIGAFRGRDDDLAIIGILAYAARGEEAELRVNATLILGNVIDNSSVCVPIDHVYDPRISANGRANLLAIIAGPVSYAFIENIRNIERVIDNFSNLPENYVDTKRIVDALKRATNDRKAKLGNSPPRGTPELLAACARYKPQWAENRLRYQD